MQYRSQTIDYKIVNRIVVPIKRKDDPLTKDFCHGLAKNFCAVEELSLGVSFTDRYFYHPLHRNFLSNRDHS
jgi:hypothetical protein